jgi:LemA protein
VSTKGQGKAGLIILIAVIVLVGGYLMSSYNRLVVLRENIPGAWAQVENVLQRRNDLIPNLVNTVKGVAKHEQQVFKDIANARAAIGGAQTLPERVAAQNQMSSALSRLLLIVENYPNLKANESFLRLQDELAGTENRIAVERMRFNQMVQEYNSRVKTFPTSVIARIGGFSPSETYFKSVETAKTPPQVQF